MDFYLQINGKKTSIKELSVNYYRKFNINVINNDVSEKLRNDHRCIDYQ